MRVIVYFIEINVEKVYAVRDVKAECYGALIVCPTVGLATRSFMEACKQERSPMAEYPADFMLYELGEYDKSSGEIRSHNVPKYIACASDFVVKMVNPEVPA